VRANCQYRHAPGSGETCTGRTRSPNASPCRARPNCWSAGACTEPKAVARAALAAATLRRASACVERATARLDGATVDRFIDALSHGDLGIVGRVEASLALAGRTRALLAGIGPSLTLAYLPDRQGNASAVVLRGRELQPKALQAVLSKRVS
jgi:hypothetical protein